MAYPADLITIRDNLSAILLAESANPRPNYTADGRSYAWCDYRDHLIENILKLNDQIIAAEGMVEISSQGIT
jgi:hypothetical protein